MASHATDDAVAAVAEALLAGPWVALTGAGVSTDSGIPDYRGPNARPATPMQYAEFVGDPRARQRYWARSLLGWRSFGAATPNAGHHALAGLQRVTPGLGVITQNVDGLHAQAGSSPVVDLHGRISDVACLTCGDISPRAELQARLEDANPHVTGSLPAGHAELRPDGDAEIDDTARFVVVACQRCGGVLKPDVVFFGESVPRVRVERAFELLAGAETLLVLGSSLTVMSGLRFVRHQTRVGRRSVCVNRGRTRGDELFDLKVDAGVSETLTSALAAVQG